MYVCATLIYVCMYLHIWIHIFRALTYSHVTNQSQKFVLQKVNELEMNPWDIKYTNNMEIWQVH